MTIQDFRSNPLSDRIINSLLSVTQAYTEVDMLINEYPESKMPLKHMLTTFDIYYYLYDTQPDIGDICHCLFAANQESEIRKIIETYTACNAYANEKNSITEVLTAGDFLIINAAINTNNSKLLNLDSMPLDLHHYIEPIWSILHDLYGPQRQYPLILETAIACFRLLSLAESYHTSIQTLNILLSTVYRNDIIFSGLLRQWLLSTDPRLRVASIDTEIALIHILDVFQEMWSFTVKLVRILNILRIKISNLIDQDYHQQALTGFASFLSTRLCIRNHDVADCLQLTGKTAIKHLKQLEKGGVLSSQKSGREIYYFNNLMLDMLRQQI